MAISIIINEKQKRTIIKESGEEQIFKIINHNYDLLKDVIKKTSSQIGVNLQFLLTWGAGIGGFMGPLNDYIRGVNPELTDMDISLILTGVITSYYFDNKELVNKIQDKIKEKGLLKAFKSAFKKGGQLKNTFFDFVNSLGITLHKVTNILSYTFIVPLLPMLYSLSQSNVSSSSIKEIAERLSGFGVLTVSGVILKELMIKIVRRFRD